MTDTNALTHETLNRLWPHGDSKVPGLRDGIVASAPSVFARYGITSKLLIAHAMAQFSHECGAGTEMVENLNYSADGLRDTWPGRFDANRASQFAHKPQQIANAVYNARIGNAVGSNDGWTYRGRGLSQTTGREGYQKLGAKTGLDLVGNPDLVNDPAHALECAVADFVICRCLEPAQQDDVREVTHRLNGGYIGLAERKEWLAKWKAALATSAVSSPRPSAAPSTTEPPAAPQPKPPVSPHAKAAVVVAAGTAAASQAGSYWQIAAIVAVVAAVCVGIYLLHRRG